MVAEMDDTVGGEIVIPIYGADELADNPKADVLVVGGYQAANAARHYYPKQIVMCGSRMSDWSVLKGRYVTLWPDGGIEGETYMRMLGEIISPFADRLVMLQVDQPEGWNLAEAYRDGWTLNQVAEYASRDNNRCKIRLKWPVKLVSDPRNKPTADAPPTLTGELMPEDILRLLVRDLKHPERIYPTEFNVTLLLTHHPDYAGRLWYDQFGRRVMLDRERIKKMDIMHMKKWCQQHFGMHYITDGAVRNGAELVADANPRHELKAYLDALQWDGAERLPGFLTNVYGADRTPYTEAVGRCWLVSAVARIYQPGCKADCMLVLEGGQGVKKSTSLRELGGFYFGEAHQNPVDHRKDFCDELQGFWIVEVPEMHILAGQRNGVEKLKGVLSTQEDNYRKSYGHEAEPFKRQCVFAGTTNLTEWNSDQTGGRRFWPVQCGEIDVDYLVEWRDQIWAEALFRYRAGEQWWDIPGDDAKAEQELRRQADVWEPIIERFVNEIPHFYVTNPRKIEYWEPRAQPLEFLRVDVILSEALNKGVDCPRSEQMRVAGILSTLGYRRRRPTINGERTYAYYPTVTRPALPKPAAPPTAAPVQSSFDDDDIPY